MPSAATGTMVWNELASTDPERVLRFYGELFGWTFEPFELPGGRYWVARHGDRMVGGIGGLDTGPAGTMASSWTCWVGVDDVDASVVAAVAAGGQVIDAACDVPKVGRVATIRDPAGAIIGLLQGLS